MLPEQRDSMTNTFVVTLVLCIGCSLLVSTAAVALKEKQGENKRLDRQRKIIEVAGLAKEGMVLDANAVTAMFTDGTIEPRVVDIQSGEYVEDTSIANPSFDERKAAKDGTMNTKINSSLFRIGISLRADPRQRCFKGALRVPLG